MDSINVMILGGGGREHALSWKIAQSGRLGSLYIAPGNAGTALVGQNLDIKETDFPAIKSAIIEHNINLLVVGPEAPLVKGVREYIESDIETENVRIIGPGRQGAMLEGSKAYSKQFMQKHGIPTAKSGQFRQESIAEAKAFLTQMKPPYVLKADGLAGGKGVLIIDDIKSAYSALDEMLDGKKFGKAGEAVVIEEFLKGIEISVFVLTDGTDYLMLPSAKDYKRIGEGDVGLNTGGMGSISPVPFADDQFMEKVRSKIVEPTIKGLKSDGIDYNGFLFIGLMNVQGEPYVIEYNCRMGDPETESVMPRISNDFLEVLWNCGGEELEGCAIDVYEEAVASVMLVSGGYPEAYAKGKPITGLENVQNAITFHAGTAYLDGRIVTNGGRVMTITAYGKDLKEALDICYQEVGNVYFEDAYYRKDLGFDL
ncbi:MAG: phosphoribosylamine--glycine ligase [Salibacteraceae bacterium]